jgi:signal transduction histidine kinase
LLVVDDNRDAADSLAMLLGGEGCAVTVAYDGETALTVALAQRPQLVLLDIGLPGMDGHAVAQAIRQRSELSPIRLVALTGYGQPADRERSQAAGFDAHLVKPVDLETLRRLLSEVRADHPPERHPPARPAQDAPQPPRPAMRAPRGQALSAPPPTRLTRCAGRHTAGALISILPHELSQPLAAIAMYSSATSALIRSGKSAPQELAEVMDRIETQVKRAAEILARLREFVSPDPAEPTFTDLCQSISDAVTLIRPFAANKQVRLFVDLPAEPVSLKASKATIGQVVLNLLFNGIEAIEQAGSTQRRVRISVHPEPTQVRLSVQDSGHGISPEDAERIFTAFASDKPHACGLGLAISRSLIEELGGRLWVDSGVSHGATLHVQLPRSERIQADQ